MNYQNYQNYHNYRNASAWQYPFNNRQRLLECYIQDLTYNNRIVEKQPLSLRLMTYNVNKWISATGGNNYHHIERILKLIKPDIFALQEYTEYNLPIFRNYNHQITDGEIMLRSNLVFDEMTTVYGQINNSTIVKLKNNLVVVSLSDVNNYHLKAILSILNGNYQQNPIVILGTLNCLQIHDYPNAVLTWLQNNSEELDFHTIKFLEDNGFVDVFCGMPMSCWSGRRVDFILTRNVRAIRQQCYYSAVMCLCLWILLFKIMYSIHNFSKIILKSK